MRTNVRNLWEIQVRKNPEDTCNLQKMYKISKKKKSTYYNTSLIERSFYLLFCNSAQENMKLHIKVRKVTYDRDCTILHIPNHWTLV